MAEQAEQLFPDINGRRYPAFRRQALAIGLAGGLIDVVTSLLMLWYLMTPRRAKSQLIFGIQGHRDGLGSRGLNRQRMNLCCSRQLCSGVEKRLMA